jgi:hypothetical protein
MACYKATVYVLIDLSSLCCPVQSYGQVVHSPDSTMFEIGVLLSNLHNRGETIKGEPVSTT